MNLAAVLACAFVLMSATAAFAGVQPPISVPEPATALFLATGAGACWAAFRARRGRQR